MDTRWHVHGMEHSSGRSFGQLAAARASAEDVYRKVKALERISALKNTKVRQPVKEYSIGEWVMIWRRKTYEGAQRPHWFGPGRVVLQETIARLRGDEPRSSRSGDPPAEAHRAGSGWTKSVPLCLQRESCVGQALSSLRSFPSFCPEGITKT